uniref:Cytochrome b5 heme-binding domain-containing protein n=1 Tax=Anopheles atroparvus TaxID=41427 RepID=A0A182JAK1_ANOAO
MPPRTEIILMNSSSSFIYLRHLLVVTLGIVLFYLVASRQKQLVQYFQNANEPFLSSEEQIFSESQLLKFNGRDSESLYLVILGNVFDVTKGVKHYGEGQTYHMFIGHDATRSFVTGEFDHFSEELSDVSSLTEADLQQLLTWKQFYDKTYPYRGKVVGRYFDQHGQETAYYQHILARAAKGKEFKKDNPQYPSCNVEWKKETGTRVWCTNRSGDGQERQWIGLPRKVITGWTEADGDEPRNIQFCACVPENVFDKQYVRFPGCEESAISCVIPHEI